uniref:Uncharacterized protein n=1 Tax=Leersia perrieri TaxID=77586 RepID=A0A0D9VCK3_9ORYZ
MASAVASSMPSPPPAVSFGWLGPPSLLPSPSSSPAAAKVEPAVSKEFIDFEFSLGGSATMLPADELFADGKLLPLRPLPVATAREMGRESVSSLPPEKSFPSPELVKTTRPATATATAAEVFDPYVFSPKAPTCSSRWRELLRLKKVQTPPPPPQKPSASPSPVNTAVTQSRNSSSSSAARSLKLLLLQRNAGGGGGGRASSSDIAVAPLLRDSSDSETSLSLASSRFSLSSSSSSAGHDHDEFPRHSLDSPRPRIRLVRSSIPQSPSIASAASKPRAAIQSPARRRPSPSPPAPTAVATAAQVDSPRMNSSGKIVFQGLERSSSSPAGPVRTRSRVMDRSYSAGVRATPVVLNVPVCSRPVFGFFKDRKETPAKDSSAARPRSALGRKLTYASAGNGVGGGASTVSCRDLGSGK